MSNINYADLSGYKISKRYNRAKSYAWRVNKGAVLLVVLGAVLLCVAGALIVPTYTQPGQLSEFVSEVKTDPSDSEGVGVDGGGEGDTDTDNIDWDTARGVDANICAWVSVDNTVIDFPVAQCEDNSYYLNYDVFGNRSMSGVFADARCNIDSNTVAVYGHHMDNGTMFENVSHTHHQDVFDTLGQLHWQTVTGTKRTYEPAFAMSVAADFADIQEFEHGRTSEQLDAAAKQIASEYKLAGLDSITYATLPPAFSERAVQLADAIALREWLDELYESADSRAENIDYLLERATNVATTITCTSNWANDRTLTVFVNCE